MKVQGTDEQVQLGQEWPNEMSDFRNHVGEQVVSYFVKIVVVGSKSEIFDDDGTYVEIFLESENLEG